MKQLTKKLLSMLLTLALLLQLLPASIFATEGDGDTLTEEERLLIDAGSLVAADEAPVEILFEEVALREENVKHFRMSDGSYRAVIYDTPVHYLDEDGQWQEYDNTLQAVSTLDGDGVSSYRVENGDSVRLFAADAASEQLLLVQTGDYSLALTPVSETAQPDVPVAEEVILPESPIEEAQPALAEADNAETAAYSVSSEAPAENITAESTAEILEEPAVSATVLSIAASAEEPLDNPFFAETQPEKLYSALEYENIADGTTLRYENYANSVKESIVISAPRESYQYAFRMQSTGLTPSLLDDGSVAFTNEAGDCIYLIPAPYMIDANDETSYDAAYTLEASGSDWLLTVTADAQWMNAAERAYPVLLDPTVTETADSDGDICAAYVRQGYPTSPDTTDTGLYVGTNGTSVGMTRTYVHVNNLPRLPSGCEPTGASFSLYQYSYYSGGNALEVGAYALDKAGNLNGHSATASWKSWADGLTWTQATNGTTTHDETILDKQTLSSAGSGDYVTWDITALAYEWYDSERSRDSSGIEYYIANLGFVLKAVNEASTNSRATFHGPKKTTCRPRITIEYRNVRGIESGNYTYETANIGKAGTAYIGDFSMQNTLVVPLASDPSDVMPFSVSLVYNSSLTGRYFSNGYDSVNTKDFSNMLVGIGWKLSLQETIVPLTLSGQTYLVYTDGDGTEHYFTYKNGHYIEEDKNSDLVITVSGSNYTMSNDLGDKKIFTNGYLTERQDAYGNALYYCYDGVDYNASSTAWKPSSTGAHKITKVYRKNVGCSAEQILLLGYNGNFLTTIIPKCDYSKETGENSKATRRIGLLRETRTSGSYLTTIQYPNGSQAQYQYLPSTDNYWRMNRMSSAYDTELNYGVAFTYSYSTKVSGIYEYILNDPASENSESNRDYRTKMHGYKRSHLLAAYRYYGDDGDANTADDILTFKVLDTMGQTVCSYSTDSSEQHILGVNAAAYTKDSANRRANNRLAASTSSGQPGVNLLRNGGAEDNGAYWSAVTASTAVYYSGAKSFLLNGNSFYQLVALQGGKTYTLSAYIRMDTAATGGIRLAFLDGNGGAISGASSPLLSASTKGVNGNWQRLSVTYTPASSCVVRASVISTNLGGSAYADCIQLEEEDAASTYNLLEDGSFENLTSFPAPSDSVFGWYAYGNVTVRTNSSSSADAANTHFGAHGTQVVGGSGGQRISQSVTLNAPAGTTFLLSGWAKANALPDSVEKKSLDSQAYFGMIVRLYYSDAATDLYYFPFNAYYSGWQQKEGIIVPAAENMGKTITSAIVVAAYDNNINTAYFDNFSLRMEPAQTYAYDANGNPISAAQTGTGSQSATYSNGVDLSSFTAANGTVTTYTYNNQHDVKTASAAGLTSTYTYNTSGNITTSKLTGSGTAYLNSSATVTANKNHAASTTDVNGSTTSYGYHDYLGQTTLVTNANNVQTVYEYEMQTGRPTKTYQSGVASVEYGYANGALSSLTRKSYAGSSPYWQRYSFDTNAWGQTTAIKVSGSSNGSAYTGEKTLATYTYNEDDGTLAGMSYANGDSVSYYYDTFDRLVKTVYNDTGRYIEYAYSADGALSSLTYKDANHAVLAVYRYEYDSLGRLVRSSHTDGADSTVQRTEHIYDAFNRPKTQKWTIGGKTRSETYTYDDSADGGGSLKQLKTSSGQKINYAYDSLKRLSTTSVTSSTGVALFNTDYTYRAQNSTKSTAQVSSRDITLDISNNPPGVSAATPVLNTDYTYDALGNILTATETLQLSATASRTVQVSYIYDEQNQLEAEQYTGAVSDLISYTYDTAGNILTEGHHGIVTKAYTYAYRDTDSGNDAWGDLLVSVDGHAISYDDSGNPLNWYNGKKTFSGLTWEQGRQLTSITTGGKTTTYAYDADGIRTEKVINGVTHHYVTRGGRLMRESFLSGSTEIIMDFSYDESGRPFAVSYSKDGGASFSTYYYATNLQGDVVMIFGRKANTDGTGYTVKSYGYYTYDAWGNVTAHTYDNKTPASTSLIYRNPLRYRGYIYDNETGFYYLQSRYYDPANHRFINADALASTGQGFVGTNMFAYCNNCPVNCEDNAGTAPGSLITTTRMCDGGAGHSSYEKQLLAELFRGEIPAEYDDPYYGSRVTKSEYRVDVPGVAHFLAKNRHSASSLFGLVGGIARVMSELAVAKVTSGISIAFSAFSLFAKEIFYGGMPVLDNGNYTVYTIDTIVSQTYYTNGANGNSEMIECHSVKSWYVSDQLGTGTVVYESSYQVVYRR